MGAKVAPLLGGLAVLALAAGCGGSHPRTRALRPLTPRQREALTRLEHSLDAQCASFRQWYARRSGPLVLGGDDAKWDRLFLQAGVREQRLIAQAKRYPVPSFARRRVRAFLRALAAEPYVLSLELRLEREGRLEAVSSGQMVKMVVSANRRLRRAASLLGLSGCTGL